MPSIKHLLADSQVAYLNQQNETALNMCVMC